MAQGGHKAETGGEIGSTIAAVATGLGALGVVRLSGPEALAVCRRFVKFSGRAAHRKALLAEIYDGDSLLDRAVAVYFQSPASFTGEDLLELTCHGSPYVLSRALALAVSNGARAARPGEFSMRAFLNGKLDLAQAEGICDLISSQNRAAHAAALELCEGRLSRRLSEIKNSLVDSLSQIEARLDDSDEEIAPLKAASFRAAPEAALREIKKLADSFSAGKLIREGARVAIVGAPNSGKSSLLNALLSKDRAIVSPAPGTTRDTIEEAADFSGLRVVLTDTAGIRRHALDPAEIEGMSRTRAALDKSDAAILVLDCSKKPGPADRLVEKELASRGLKTVAALNKCDLARKKSAPEGDVRISCKTGEGLDELKKKLVSALGLGGRRDERIITCARHYDALRRAARELDRLMPLTAKKPVQLELCAEHLNSALSALGEIAGQTTPEDVLSAVFAKFCVGK